MPWKKGVVNDGLLLLSIGIGHQTGLFGHHG